MKTTILVADEHDIVRSGIVSALSTGRDLEVVAETTSGSEVLGLYRELRPTVVLIEIGLPGMNGFDVAKELIREDAAAKVLMLTMQLNETSVLHAVKSGVLGYMLKNAERHDLLEGVKQVSRGRTYFSVPVMKIMADYYVQKHRPAAGDMPAHQNLGLTPREREILAMIADSLTSQDIAEKLFISQRTVETHRSNIMQKLGIKNSTGLVRFALEHGILGTV